MRLLQKPNLKKSDLLFTFLTSKQVGVFITMIIIIFIVVIPLMAFIILIIVTLKQVIIIIVLSVINIQEFNEAASQLGLSRMIKTVPQIIKKEKVCYAYPVRLSRRRKYARNILSDHQKGEGIDGEICFMC